MLEIRENVPLAPRTTFGIGGAARWFAEAKTAAEIVEAIAWTGEHGLPLFVLGGGSNLLVRDQGFQGLVLQMAISGRDDLGDGLFAVGAGEPWDGFVEYAVQGRYAGIECLAGIPGSVGGTPVQNVGAYGQEVSQTIAAVHAVDRTTKESVTFDTVACNFRYRESRFNTDEPNRYIVFRVDFQLKLDGVPTLRYIDLKDRFGAQKTSPTLMEVANTVREIRRSKGMLLVDGDSDCRSAGSFFKNPIVPADVLARIEEAVAPGVPPRWPMKDGLVKLPAAWLLEKAGFVKGFGNGPAGISSRHTLALINRGGATFADVERLQDEIVRTVREKFGVGLEREPVVVG